MRLNARGSDKPINSYLGDDSHYFIQNMGQHPYQIEKQIY